MCRSRGACACGSPSSSSSASSSSTRSASAWVCPSSAWSTTPPSKTTTSSSIPTPPPSTWYAFLFYFCFSKFTCNFCKFSYFCKLSPTDNEVVICRTVFELEIQTSLWLSTCVVVWSFISNKRDTDAHACASLIICERLVTVLIINHAFMQFVALMQVRTRYRLHTRSQLRRRPVYRSVHCLQCYSIFNRTWVPVVPLHVSGFNLIIFSSFKLIPNSAIQILPFDEWHCL